MTYGFFRSLRFRLIALVLAGILPPMLVAIFFASSHGASVIREESREKMALRAHALADNVNRWDKTNIMALRSLSENTAFINLDSHRHLPLLSTLYRLHSETYALATLDSEGYIIASGWGKIDVERTNLKERSYFKAVMNGTPIVRETIISRTYKQPAVIFVAPIYERRTLTLNDSSPLITEAQQSLGDIGYYQGTPTGVLDEVTQNALRNYQSDYLGLTPNGDLDPLTFDLLRRENGKQPLPADATQGIKGATFMATFLTDLGKMVGTIRLGSTGYAFLVNEKGDVIAHPEKSLVTGEHFTSFRDYAPVKTLLDGNEGFFTFSDNENRRWLSYGIHLDNGWSDSRGSSKKNTYPDI